MCSWLRVRLRWGGGGGCFFFFFRAEDSIRDAQESRGLGDVYKRQGTSLVETITVGYAPVKLTAFPLTDVTSMLPPPIDEPINS